MTSLPNFKTRAGDGNILIGEVSSLKEMRMFDRLPRSLQNILRESPVGILAISAMDTYLQTDERTTIVRLQQLIDRTAPGATPIRICQSRRRRAPFIDDADAYAVPRPRGRRRAR